MTPGNDKRRSSSLGEGEGVRAGVCAADLDVAWLKSRAGCISSNS